jgi:hypothetical protein
MRRIVCGSEKSSEQKRLKRFSKISNVRLSFAMLLAWIFVQAILGLNASTVADVQALLEMLEQIEAVVASHTNALSEFTSQFDFLAKSDQNLQARMQYLQYYPGIRDDPFEFGEVPLIPPSRTAPYVIPKQQTLNSKLYRLLMNPNHGLGFSFKIRGESAVSSLRIRGDSSLSCLINEFDVVFDLSDKSTVALPGLVLDQSQEWSTFQFPTPVAFQQMRILPLSNFGNETHDCLLDVNAFGIGRP